MRMVSPNSVWGAELQVEQMIGSVGVDLTREVADGDRPAGERDSGIERLGAVSGADTAPGADRGPGGSCGLACERRASWQLLSQLTGWTFGRLSAAVNAEDGRRPESSANEFLCPHSLAQFRWSFIHCRNSPGRAGWFHRPQDAGGRWGSGWAGPPAGASGDESDGDWAREWGQGNETEGADAFGAA